MPDLSTARGLREQRMSLVKEAQEIGKKEEHNAEDEARIDAILADVGDFHTDTSPATGLAAKVERAEKLETLGSEYQDDQHLRNLPNKDYREVKAGDQPTPQERRDAFQAWTSYGTKAFRDGHAQAAKKCGLDYRSNQVVIPTFAKQPRSHEELARMVEARATSDALAQGTAAFGGNTVPNAAMQAVEEALLDYGGIRQVANVMRTPTGATLPIPTLDDTGNGGAILAENTATTIHTMVFGQLTFGAYKYTSRLIQASIEFMQDTSMNFDAWVGGAVGERIARAQAGHFATGSGSTATQPAGLAGVEGGSTTMSSALGVTASTYRQVIFTEWMSLLHSVDPAYRRSPACQFVLNDETLLLAKQVTISSSEAVPLWLPSVRVGTPDQILGYPFTVDQGMPKYSTNGGGQLRPVVFGDMKKYLIRDVMGVTLLRLNERYAEYGQVAFVGFARADGGVTQIGALKHLITASSS